MHAGGRACEQVLALHGVAHTCCITIASQSLSLPQALEQQVAAQRLQHSPFETGRGWPM